MNIRNQIIKGVVNILILTTPSFITAEDKIIHEAASSNEIEVHNTILAVAGADLDISPVKISKSVSWTMNFLAPLSLEQRKENLLIELCKDSGADIIVDPQFTYKKRVLGGGKLTLSGYPAYYKNFRSLNEAEIDSIIINKNKPENTIIFINR